MADSPEAVKRNGMRFPESFCFRLTQEGSQILKSQIATSSLLDDYASNSLKRLTFVLAEQTSLFMAENDLLRFQCWEGPCWVNYVYVGSRGTEYGLRVRVTSGGDGVLRRRISPTCLRDSSLGESREL